VIRIRFVSSLFIADVDVHEDPLLIKLETIKKEYYNNFDKQFALKLKVRSDRLKRKRKFVVFFF
jgi:hypothetical protein